jgi:membrane carboxypeptidase/penicillin-binding protein
MSELDIRPPLAPRKIWTLKRFLFKIYVDLEKVSYQCFSGFNEVPLRPIDYMILILEDRRYFSHRGVDVASVIRELFRAITLQRHGGASTIEMQFIRTCLNYRQKTLSRKFYEILLAIIIQYRHSKMTLLRSYEDNMFLGSGLIGIDNASRAIFGKYADQLDFIEAAFIASMMVYPKPLVPSQAWEEKIARRQAYGLKLLLGLKDSLDKSYARHLV